MNNKIKAIIIDDELDWQNIIKKYAEKIPEISIEGTFSEVETAHNFLLENDIQLIFLDIQINDKNGIEFIKQLHTTHAIIIISSHIAFALDGYSISALDYLTKPIEFEKLKLAVQKAIKSIEVTESTNRLRGIRALDKEYFLVKEELGLLKIPYKEVVYISALGNYIKIHTSTKTHIVLVTLSQFENSISHHPFIRIHRSYIINLNHIKILLKDSCIMHSNEKIPMSEVYRSDVHEVFAKDKIVKK